MIPSSNGFPWDRTPLLAGLGLIVGALCYGSSVFFEGTPGITAFWPANAVALAFVLRACRTPVESRWAFATALVAMLAANLAMGRPAPVALVFSLANVAEVAVAAWFMRRIVMPLCGLRDLGQFLLGAVLAGPLVSTLMAALFMFAGLGLTGDILVERAGAWFLADALGMAIVAPFALSLGSVRRGAWIKALAAPAAIGVFCFVLSWQRQLPVVFLAFPLVALAVLHDRDRGGALGVGAVALSIIGSALVGQGPIARLPALGIDPGIAMPIYFGALVLTVYPLSAALKELDVLAGELDRRRAAAEHASAAKSELIGRVGEELRSPLTGVVTVAEMLRSGRLGDLNTRQRDLLARIAESGAEIEALSREMVALADGAERSLRSAPLAGVVRDAVSAVRFRASRAKVSLEVLAGDEAWRAAIDPERLKRLVVDALGEALDAAPRGSTVRIIAGLEGQAALRLVVEDAGQVSLVSRQARFNAASRGAPAVDGLAFDRAELRRIGGDLCFGPGPLGGGQTLLILPCAVDAPALRAA